MRPRDQHKLQKPTAHSLASYATEWLPRRQSTGKKPLAPTTAHNYSRYIAQDIAPSKLGKTKLSEIRPTAETKRQVESASVAVIRSQLATVSHEPCSCCSSPRPSQPAPVPGSPTQPREESFPALVNDSCDSITGDASLRSIELAIQFHDPALESGRTRLLWFCAWRP